MKRVLVFMAAGALIYLGLGLLMPQWNLAERKQTLRELENLVARLKASPNNPDAVAEFRSRLNSSYAFERRQAYAYVGKLDDASMHYLEEIRAGLSSSDPYVRREAAHAPLDMGAAARGLVPDLIATTKAYPNADAGWFAALSLAEVAAPDDERVAAVLKALTESPSDMMRKSAVRALNDFEARRSETLSQESRGRS